MSDDHETEPLIQRRNQTIIETPANIITSHSSLGLFCWVFFFENRFLIFFCAVLSGERSKVESSRMSKSVKNFEEILNVKHNTTVSDEIIEDETIERRASVVKPNVIRLCEVNRTKVTFPKLNFFRSS